MNGHLGRVHRTCTMGRQAVHATAVKKGGDFRSIHRSCAPNVQRTGAPGVTCTEVACEKPVVHDGFERRRPRFPAASEGYIVVIVAGAVRAHVYVPVLSTARLPAHGALVFG